MSHNMSEDIQKNTVVTVPEEIHRSLLTDGTDVQTKVGHVANFNHEQGSNNLEENVILGDSVNYKKPKDNEFIGLTREELKLYINNPKWKRIRWIIAILYIIVLVLLLAGSILLVVFSQRCPPKPKLEWYQKEIIYEIDVPTFYDSNKDGIGDIKGVQQKISYLEDNKIKSILFRSSIFNVTTATSIRLDGTPLHNENIDLLRLDPLIGSDNDLQDLSKLLYRRDMHLIIDLPLSSTVDPNGYSWYGSTSPLPIKITNPCVENEQALSCQYYKLYGRLPLNFTDENIYQQSEFRLRHWLSEKKIDGVRVDLPLDYNSSTNSYEISHKTINRWIKVKNQIAKNAKSKLLLIDIPFTLQRRITDDYLHNITPHSLFLFDDQLRTTINARSLDQRIQSFEENRLSMPQFWQLGSKRRSDDVGIVDENQLSKEMVLTMVMLLRGTPVVLYGEEIGLDQKINPLMPWTSKGPYGGFSSCSSADCERILSSYQINLSKTSVKRQLALGGEPKDSLLTVFRRLSEIRQYESFQFGLIESGYDEKTNIFWFIREAPGHRGYVIVFNLNKNPTDIAHISLHRFAKNDVPFTIHYEYQWPKAYLSTSNKTDIDSDNLFIHSQSINIFWWKPKLLKPNVLFKTAKEHSHNH